MSSQTRTTRRHQNRALSNLFLVRPAQQQTIFVGPQAYVLYRGTEGDDLIDLRGEANPTIGYGLGGDDTIFGTNGADRIYAGPGNDLVDAGSGADDVHGGVGDDVLLGGIGADTLQGDEGIDTADYSASGSGVAVRLWTGPGIGGDAEGDVLSGIENLIGSDHADILVGNFGQANLLKGGLGADLLKGLSGNDLLRGGDGADTLQGDEWNDTLEGGADNDVLTGGADRDVLRGGHGEDSLSGGLGQDFLTGGADADVFVFGNMTETGVGQARDQILDFEMGVDLIDLAAMSAGVFEFRGTSGFAPSGNPELRLFETPTGSTIVQIDNNGDGTIDAEIRVANTTGLTAEDFVL